MSLLLFICLFVSSAVASPSIKVSSNGSYRHGQYVDVRWEGVENSDRDSCWFGVFFHGADVSYAGPSAFPATPPFLKTAPIKFAACDGSHFKETGAGNRSVRLLAYREPLEFVLFAGGYGSLSVPRLLARSAVALVASDGFEPRFPRLAHTRVVDEMQLTWSSLEAHPTVAELFANNDSMVLQRAWSSVKTYGPSDLCSAPANSIGFAAPGFHHTVVFTALSPGTYTYRIQSLEGKFRMKAERHIRIGVIADVGATEPDGMHYHWEEPNASTTYDMTLAREPDLVLHLGDLAYATGYEAKWDLFLDQMTPLSGRVPYMTALGNHEQDWPAGEGPKPHALDGADSGGECAVPTYTRFPMPAADQSSGWYQFSQGPVAFIIFNSEWNVTAGSPQHLFLAKALASVDRRATPWVVVGCHRPIYTGNAVDGADGILGHDDVEDLLLRFEVDFMFYGHVHNAQRTCPIYRSKCQTPKNAGGYAAPVHAVIGNGGQSLTRFPSQRAPWSLFQEFGFGFNELEINETIAILRFFGESGKLLDETIYSRPLRRQSDSELVV